MSVHQDYLSKAQRMCRFNLKYTTFKKIKHFG